MKTAPLCDENGSIMLFIRPRAGFAVALERGPLGSYTSQVVAQLFGEGLHYAGVLLRQVMLFANIVRDMKELLAACLIIIDQFPLVFADGAVQVDAGSVIAPDVRKVPYECSPFRRMTFLLQLNIFLRECRISPIVLGQTV